MRIGNRSGHWARMVGVVAVVLLSLLGTAAVANASPATAKVGPATAMPFNETVHIAGSISPALRDCYHPAKQPYPSTNCTLRFYLTPGSAVSLVCQTAGQTIGDDYYWDYVQTGNGYGYVTDEYVYTSATTPPYRDYNVPLCSY